MIAALQQADSTVQAAIDAGLVPGTVLLIARDGETLHEKAYGFASLVGADGRMLEAPERMTTDHVFDLASLTKVLATTFGVMLLVDRGEI
ncbi:MAG: serine hydrolase, partial [Rhodothermales bacterium]|nr:serine hydrolase [Rhodothermales bacterium]